MYSFPYIFFYFIISFFSFCKIKFYNSWSQTKYNTSLFGGVILLFLVFFGFRNFISTDSVVYYPFFKQCPAIYEDGLNFIFNKRNGWEIGFVILTVLIKTITRNWFVYQFILFLLDILLLLVIFKSILKSTRMVLIGFCIFFIFHGFEIERNLFRNCKSILLFFYSLKYIRHRNFFKYSIFNLFGFLFHTSSILYIPMYFILIRKFSNRCLITLYILGQIFFLLQISWLKAILLPVADYLPGRLGQLMSLYLSGAITGYGISIGYLERTCSTILFFIFYKKLLGCENNRPYINCFIIYQFIYLFFSDIAIFPQRVGLLFCISYWIIFPQIYMLLKKDWKVAFFLCILVYSALRLYKECNSSCFIYQNYLFNYFELRTFEEYEKDVLWIIKTEL